MKNEIMIPILRQEDLVAASNRREKYSLTRDIQAAEFNKAIADRLEKDKVKEEPDLSVDE